MESKSISKYIKCSPLKIARILDSIRGKSTSQALRILQLTSSPTNREIEKVLKSAIANGKITDLNKAYIKQVYVTNGPILKRIRFMARGRTGRKWKRTAHIFITIDTY